MSVYNWKLKGNLLGDIDISTPTDIDYHGGRVILLPYENCDGGRGIKFFVYVDESLKDFDIIKNSCMKIIMQIIQMWGLVCQTKIEITNWILEPVLNEDESILKHNFSSPERELRVAWDLLRTVERSSKTTALLRCSEWYMKSFKEIDPFNSFISIWIGFNVLYNINSANISEVGRVRSICNLLQNRDQIIQELETKLQMRNHFREFTIRLRGGRDVKETFISDYERGNYQSAFQSFLECLYAIRCNLFHGEKSSGSPYQSKLISKCHRALTVIISNAFQEYIRSNC